MVDKLASQGSTPSQPSVGEQRPRGVQGESTGSSQQQSGGNGGSIGGDKSFKNVDAKLIPAMPVCSPEKWGSRPQQILGFSQYIESFSAWLSTLAPAYTREIEDAVTSTGQYVPSTDVAVQERSHRLFFILKQAFGASPKLMSEFRLYEASLGGFMVPDGYAMLRRLRKEYSILTRTEGLFVRHLMAQWKVSKQQASNTKEVVTALESELYLFDRLLRTLGDQTLRDELSLPDTEKFRLLWINVDEGARSYLQLHAGDTFEEAKTAAIRFHERTVLLGQGFTNTPTLSLSAFGNHQEEDRSKKDMDKVECWRCGKKGRFARNCPNSSNPSSREGTPRREGSSKTSHARMVFLLS